MHCAPYASNHIYSDAIQFPDFLQDNPDGPIDGAIVDLIKANIVH